MGMLKIDHIRAMLDHAKNICVMGRKIRIEHLMRKMLKIYMLNSSRH